MALHEQLAGLHHITKLRSSAGVLRDAILCGKFIDDRPPRTLPDGWMEILNLQAKALIEAREKTGKAPCPGSPKRVQTGKIQMPDENLPPDETPTNIIRLKAPASAPSSKRVALTAETVLKEALALNLDHVIVLGIKTDGAPHIEANDGITMSQMAWLHFQLGLALGKMINA